MQFGAWPARHCRARTVGATATLRSNDRYGRKVSGNREPHAKHADLPSGWRCEFNGAALVSRLGEAIGEHEGGMPVGWNRDGFESERRSRSIVDGYRYGGKCGCSVSDGDSSRQSRRVIERQDIRSCVSCLHRHNGILVERAVVESNESGHGTVTRQVSGTSLDRGTVRD